MLGRGGGDSFSGGSHTFGGLAQKAFDIEKDIQIEAAQGFHRVDPLIGGICQEKESLSRKGEGVWCKGRGSLKNCVQCFVCQNTGEKYIEKTLLLQLKAPGKKIFLEGPSLEGSSLEVHFTFMPRMPRANPPTRCHNEKLPPRARAVFDD